MISLKKYAVRGIHAIKGSHNSKGDIGWARFSMRLGRLHHFAFCWWQTSENGVFTIKSAYDILKPPPPSTGQFQWTQIWNFKGPVRGSLFLWMLAHNRLKTKGLLWRRNVVPSASCELCGADDESILHALRDCPHANHLWKLLLKDITWSDFWLATEPQTWLCVNFADFLHLLDLVALGSISSNKL